MTATILKGKEVGDAIVAKCVEDSEALRAKGIIPKLTIIRVGERQDDLAYERGALKKMDSCKIDVEVVVLPADINQADFVAKFKEINDDPKTNAILMFRPLPEQLNEEEIKVLIKPEKDVDCMNAANMGKLMIGDETGFYPCTAMAVMEILNHFGIDVKGKDVAVINNSNVIGKPVSIMLTNAFATVTICHVFTKDVKTITKNADIVISAVGRAGLVQPDQLKEGCVLIDVAITQNAEGKMCGDAAPECAEVAGMLTPVPGGVGSVTTSVLAKYVIKACKIQNNLF